MEVDPEDKNKAPVYIPVPKYMPNNGQVSKIEKALSFGGSWSNLSVFNSQQC
jgi:hypothetical protein